MKQDILGYGVDAHSVEECADIVFATLRGETVVRRQCSWLACLNPHSYAVALDDILFSQALKDADCLVPADGQHGADFITL